MADRMMVHMVPSMRMGSWLFALVVVGAPCISAAWVTIRESKLLR